MTPNRTRRQGFSRRAQYSRFAGYVVALTSVLVAIVLLALSRIEPAAFAALRSGVATLTTPVSSVLARVTGGIAALPDAVGSYFAVHGENAALRRRVAAQGQLLMRARTLSYENHRLLALLHVRERVVRPVVVARLVSSTASSARRFAVLNAGSFQGVAAGQPVRGPDGLVGQVIEVGPATARILLLIDPESSVPVRRTRDGLAALAQGRGDGLLDIRSVTGANIAFGVGDVFVTSGTGGLFAPDVPVGRIVRTTPDGGVASSFAQPDTLDYALVQQAYLPVPAPAATPALP